jgi:hypothetical protein
MVNWYTIIIVAIVLIAIDKGLTVANIKAVQRDNPTVDPLSIEKNPIARLAFQKTGLFWGTILYGIFSLGTFFFALLLFYYPAKVWAPTNAWGVSFYVMCLVYAFILMNNFYFLLRYNHLL